MKNFDHFLSDCRERLVHQECILLSVIAAGALQATPLQHYMTLSRLQHYSIGILVIAIGFLLQTAVSWRSVNNWGRLTFFSSALYLGTFAVLFYTNPWLDAREGMETISQRHERKLYCAYFAFAGIPLAFVWTRWSIDRMRAVEKTAAKTTVLASANLKE